MGEDYYTTLGVPRNADQSTITKSYRKLAMLYHPDKQHSKTDSEKKIAEDKFKKIANAYEVLSDKDKRRVYDQYGEAGLQGGVPMGGGGGGGQGFSGFPGGGQFFFSTTSGGGRGGFSDPRDVFARFFGGMGLDDSDDDDMMFSSRRAKQQRAKPQQQQQQQQQQPKKPAAPVKPEPTVHTIGVTLAEMFTGCTKKLKLTRTRGGKSDDKIIEIEVRPGWKAGTKLTYADEGDQAPNGLYSDVIFVIAEKPNDTYTRNNNDLIIKVPITISDALCGIKKNIPHVDGTMVPVDTTNQVISPENNKTFIFGRGFPNAKNGPGNFVIEWNIVWPSRPLTSTQKEHLKKAGI